MNQRQAYTTGCVPSTKLMSGVIPSPPQIVADLVMRRERHPRWFWFAIRSVVYQEDGDRSQSRLMIIHSPKVERQSFIAYRYQYCSTT